MVDRLKRLLASRYRISTQLYLAIGGAVALTIAASLVGWFSFDRVGSAQSRVNEGSVPELAAAFGVAQYSGELTAAAPNLVAATTREEFARISSDIDRVFLEFKGHLALLEARYQTTGGSGAMAMAHPQDSDGATLVTDIRHHSDRLIGDIEALKTETFDSFSLAEQRITLQGELTGVRAQLDDLLAPAIDDQFFYTITGYRELAQPADARSQYFTEDELVRYRRLSEIQGSVNIATELLANAFTLSDASLIEPLKERFEATASLIERNLGTLAGSAFHEEATPVFGRLFALGLGDGSVFAVFKEELELEARQHELLATSRADSLQVVVEVNNLVSLTQANTQDATDASSQAIFTGRTLLLVISGVSVIGAVLITWLFLRRMLLRRLGMLSDWMRRMAGGDLETTVEMAGRDEVADMAAALEVFRRNSLEAQRLNLVEQLANELQGKNAELEDTLGELNKAQDQIVMREKLAALGELTAGVAHEIRNPLNFVNNFSEVSGELLDELQEVLEEEGVELNEEQKSLVEEITGDLTSNLERIRSHGLRANRIVENMLRMGRSSGEWLETDINGLLEEHARLAYHSARATDSDFQLDIKEEFDPEAGSLEVIPQDLGRVFLNMVSNACYATNERRAATPGAGVAGGPYAPTVWLSTQRREDHVEVRIKDNGTGMPPEVIDKIFNPFFTTKPTDQGTGLGLSLSNDIVRRHGGQIRVNSEPGEYTEMIIEVPLERPTDTDAAETPADPDGDDASEEEAEAAEAPA